MTNGVQFVNDYRYVDTYYNGKKIAGSNIIEPSGEHLSVDNTYNDSAYIEVEGKTVEVGSGDKAPDNPYELKSVSGKAVSAGKNLYNGYFETTTGSTAYPLSSYGGYSGVVNFWNRIKLPFTNLIPNTQYTLSFTGRRTVAAGGDGSQLAFMKGNTAGNYAIITSTVFADFSLTITSNSSGGLDLLIQNRTNTIDIPFEIYNIQVEKGTTATSRKPFKGISTVTIPELRSIPNGTTDTVIIDNKLKTAKLIRQLGVKVFNGTEAWYAYTETNNDYKCTYFLSFADAYSGYSQSNCTHFENKADYIWTSSNKQAGVYCDHPSTVNKYFNYYPDTVPSDWKAYLAAQYSAGTPVTVIYRLATPTETQLDYETVKTFYPYTQIYTTSVVQPTIEAKIRVLGA